MQGTPSKAIHALLILGVAIAGLAVTAPSASAACVWTNPDGNGIVIVQTGTGDGTPPDDCYRYVSVLGHQIYP
jgi:hypothetical protein